MLKEIPRSCHILLCKMVFVLRKLKIISLNDKSFQIMFYTKILHVNPNLYLTPADLPRSGADNIYVPMQYEYNSASEQITFENQLHIVPMMSITELSWRVVHFENWNRCKYFSLIGWIQPPCSGPQKLVNASLKTGLHEHLREHLPKTNIITGCFFWCWIVVVTGNLTHRESCMASLL